MKRRCSEFFNQLVGGSVDESETVLEQLDRKADRSTVESLLADKAGAEELAALEDTLAGKPDAAEVAALLEEKVDLSALVTHLAGKVGVEEVATLLGEKAATAEVEMLRAELAALREAVVSLLRQNATLCGQEVIPSSPGSGSFSSMVFSVSDKS